MEPVRLPWQRQVVRDHKGGDTIAIQFQGVTPNLTRPQQSAGADSITQRRYGGQPPSPGDSRETGPCPCCPQHKRFLSGDTIVSVFVLSETDEKRPRSSQEEMVIKLRCFKASLDQKNTYKTQQQQQQTNKQQQISRIAFILQCKAAH